MQDREREESEKADSRSGGSGRAEARRLTLSLSLLAGANWAGGAGLSPGDVLCGLGAAKPPRQIAPHAHFSTLTLDAPSTRRWSPLPAADPKSFVEPAHSIHPSIHCHLRCRGRMHWAFVSGTSRLIGGWMRQNDMGPLRTHPKCVYLEKPAWADQI